MKKYLFFLLQIFWCLPQNLAGLILFCFFHLRKEQHYFFRGAIVTGWDRECCTSIGCFIFMDRDSFRRNRGLLLHEYGHTIQSCILGWLYLPVIFLPSVIWFSVPLLNHFRQKKHYSYYRFYTERWANHLAEKFCKERPFR
ncbi:MAG: hypothetical protein IJJ69_13680 [Oscillospiraceae bacterium]|nr:hypothetical protein [Oscillospiraceae bacterium]